MQKSPSAITRNAVIGRLADPTSGLNATYASLATDYPGCGPLSITFTGKTYNFFQGRISVDEIISSGTYKFPLMNCYATAGANRNRQKFTTYDGLVKVYAEVHLSGAQYLQSSALQNSEVWADAVEDTMIRVINGGVQSWANGIAFNGELAYDRSQVAEAGENWLQSLIFQMTFECIV